MGSSAHHLEEQHQREMIRIHEMWQATKAELRSKTRELEELRSGEVHANSRVKRENEAAVAQMHALTIELRDKLRFTELQLAAAREEGSGLAASLETLRQQLADAQAEATEQRELYHRQAPQLMEIQTGLSVAQQEKQELANRLREAELAADGVANTKEQTIQLQEQKLRALHDKLRRSGEANSSTARALEAANARVADVERSNSELGLQLLQAKEQLKFLHVARRSEAQVQSLLQQLQLDNTRLVKLLASTDEYREFAANADASGGLTYVPPPAAGSAASNAAKGTEGAAWAAASSAAAADGMAPVRDRPVRGPARETGHWVPSDTYALSNDFRRQHTPEVPMDVFAELLIRLNRVWRAREKRNLERQRAKLQKVIVDLRRRLSQGIAYGDVIKDSEVERLKRELKEVRMTFNSGRRRLNETEEKLLETSLESVEGLNLQLRQAREKNDALIHQLADQEARNEAAFEGGAAAAGRHATEIVDRFAERTNELVRELQRRTITINKQDPELYTRMLQQQSWFLGDLERKVLNCRERVGGVHDAVLSEQAQHKAARDESGAFGDEGGVRDGPAEAWAGRNGGLGSVVDESDEFDDF